MDEWKSARRNGPVQIGVRSTQTKDGATRKDVNFRLARAYSAMTKLAILWGNKGVRFPTEIKLYSSLVLSVGPTVQWM